METDASLIVLISILAIAIVGFLLYSFVSNKIKRDRIMKHKKAMKELEERSLAEFCARVNIVIENNKEMLNKFVVSIGFIKMSDINLIAKYSLEHFMKHEKVVESFINNPYKTTDIFIDNLSELVQSKSNLWDKKNSKNLEYFRDLQSFLQNYEDPKIVDLYKQSQEKYSQFFQNLVSDLNFGKIDIDKFKNEIIAYDEQISALEKSTETKPLTKKEQIIEKFKSLLIWKR